MTAKAVNRDEYNQTVASLRREIQEAQDKQHREIQDSRAEAKASAAETHGRLDDILMLLANRSNGNGNGSN